jgi:hypothetical protein
MQNENKTNLIYFVYNDINNYFHHLHFNILYLQLWLNI